MTRVATIALSLALLSSTSAVADVGDQYDLLGTRNYVPSSARNFHHPTRTASVIGGRPAACFKWPKTRRLYCGCASADYVGLSNPTGFWNLARNWFRLPRANPGPGMAEVRRSHVRIIIGGGPHIWKFYDPNSGKGLTRIATGPIRGTVVNPHGGRS